MLTAIRLFPIVQCKRVTDTLEDCAPLSGGRPCVSTALTVALYVPWAVEPLMVTASSEVAEAPPDTVAGAGVAQDGAGSVIPEMAQEKSTLPVKPLNGITVIVEVAMPVSMSLGVRGVRVTL